MRIMLVLLPLFLSGCSVNPAQVAADAAFCSSAESLLQNIGDAYERELVDSELLASASNFFSGLSNPLSEEMSQDVENLLNQLSSSAPVTDSQEAVDQLLSDISARCLEVGVEF